jgi:hypothetical protein
MGSEDFIEVDCYEGGSWITRRYPVSVATTLAEQLVRALPREVAVNLLRRLTATLGALESSQQTRSEEGLLHLRVE